MAKKQKITKKEKIGYGVAPKEPVKQAKIYRILGSTQFKWFIFGALSMGLLIGLLA